MIIKIIFFFGIKIKENCKIIINKSMRFLVILCIIASIFTVSLDKAVAYLISHAENRSIGKCGLYVHRALEAGGFHPYLPRSAYQYWSDGLLKNIGFNEIKKPSSFKKGDITVTESNASHPDGHMAMWTGTQWISDFVQNSEFVYSYNQPPVHYFRYGKITGGGDDIPSGSEGCNGKTVTEMANEVIQGKWGNGQDRINKLTAAGCDYQAIQNEVDRILGY